MSSPDTNLDKQSRRHKGPLIGFVISAVFVGMLIFVYVGRDRLPNDAAADQSPTTTNVSQ